MVQSNVLSPGTKAPHRRALLQPWRPVTLPVGTHEILQESSSLITKITRKVAVLPIEFPSNSGILVMFSVSKFCFWIFTMYLRHSYKCWLLTLPRIGIILGHRPWQFWAKHNPVTKHQPIFRLNIKIILHNYNDLMTNSSVYLPWISVAGIYKRSPRCDHHQQIMFELDPVVEDAENAQPSGGQLGLSKNGAHLQRAILIGTIVILI